MHIVIYKLQICNIKKQVEFIIPPMFFSKMFFTFLCLVQLRLLGKLLHMCHMKYILMGRLHIFHLRQLKSRILDMHPCMCDMQYILMGLFYKPFLSTFFVFLLISVKQA